MKTKYLSYSGVVLRFITLFILLASLLFLPKVQAAIGDSFTINGLRYTVLTEEPASKTGTVSVKNPPEGMPTGDLVIPARVTNNGFSYSVTLIPEFAFEVCFDLTGIVIPAGVVSIGREAFGGCMNLRSITIPESVASIADYAFSGCSSLRKIAIPGGVTSIGDYTFLGCSSMTNIVIPESVASIGKKSFSDCSSLTSVIIPEGVTYLGDYAFTNCTNLTGIVIPNGVTYLGSYAFRDCSSLTNIIIPDNVTYIGIEAFRNCSSLTNVTIGSRVNSIGRDAFRYCSKLTGITIPDRVTAIGRDAFSGCSSLMDIVVGENNPNYSSLDGVLFNKDQTTLILCPNVKNGAYTVPESVTSIGYSAFNGCTGLTSVTIGNSVRFFGDYAFNGCNGLTSIVIPSSVTSIGYYAFGECSSLTGVYFEGNAPSATWNSFTDPAVIYYRTGTTGWTNPWNRRPTEKWLTAPEITVQPQSQAVIEGDSVTFSVGVWGTAPMSYQWYKDGAVIEGATGLGYTIESVTAEDTGNYSVLVSNEDGTVLSADAALTLKQPYRATATPNCGWPVGPDLTDGAGDIRGPQGENQCGTGSCFEAHCIIENGVVVEIVIDNPGSGYLDGTTLDR